MKKLRLLDAFCGEGGASMGYHRAGYEVFGVDLFEQHTQKRYPFPSHKGDAIEYIKEHGHEYDIIVGSPPCQHASAGTRSRRKNDGKTYPALIEPTRDAMIATGKPDVLETARYSALLNPTELCGCMFDLSATDVDGITLFLQRPRGFESNFSILIPRLHDHRLHEWVGGSYGGARRDKYEAKYVRKGGYVPSISVQQALLGIDWMTQKGMHQSVPPDYTEWVGRQLWPIVATSVPRL